VRIKSLAVRAGSRFGAALAAVACSVGETGSEDSGEIPPDSLGGCAQLGSNWNNTGDKVILRRADGSLKDTCSYPGDGASKYYC
jgi:hypothetical protein